MENTQMKAVEDCLSNDEWSSDSELLEHFINEIGLSKEEAEKAIQFRTRYLCGEDHLI